MIERGSLQDAALDACRSLWIRGELGIGRINESRLAGRLGISRTPLREALRAMEAESLVRSEAGRGFSVEPPSIEEAEEIYALLAELEPLAIRAGAPHSRDALSRMRALLDGMAVPGAGIDGMHALARQWEGEILAACGNSLLRSLLQSLYRLAARYEHLNLSGAFDMPAALAAHHALLDALVAGDVDGAAGRSRQCVDACRDALRTALPGVRGWEPTARRAQA